VELAVLRAWDCTHGRSSTKSAARHEKLPVLLQSSVQISLMHNAASTCPWLLTNRMYRTHGDFRRCCC
jgi:hypothetical protein